MVSPGCKSRLDGVILIKVTFGCCDGISFSELDEGLLSQDKAKMQNDNKRKIIINFDFISAPANLASIVIDEKVVNLSN